MADFVTQALTDRDLAELLARGPFAGAAAKGAALVVAGRDPTRAVFATPAALAAFGARDLAALDAVVFGAQSPGARRLRGLVGSLPIGGAPRLESLRFFVGRMPVPVNWLCARILAPNGAAFFVAGAPKRATDADLPNAPSASEEATPKPGAPAVATNASSFTPPPIDGPVRFLWTADAEGRFGPSDAVVAARLGPHAPQQGETVETLRARINSADFEALGLAIAARRTFSGLRLAWPEAGHNRARIVVVSGAPVMDRERQFLGFRGFGLFTGETAELQPAVDAEAAVPVSPEGSASIEAHDLASASSLAAMNAFDAEAAPVEAPADVAALTEPSSSEPHEAASGDIASWENEFRESKPEFVGASLDEEPSTAAGLISTESFAPPPMDIAPPYASPRGGRDGGAEILVFRPPASSSSQNVVPIRPGALNVLSANLEHPEPSRNGGDSVELTSQERDAFKEIARALGVRTRGPRLEKEDGESPEPVSAVDKAPASPDAQQALLSSDIAAPAHRDLSDLLDQLPIGALVMRAGEAVYLNRTLLDLVGFSDLAEFRARDGIKHIFRGRDPEALTPPGEGGGMPLVAADGEFMTVDAQARMIFWDGAPAVLISMRRSREADHQAELRAVEQEARQHATQARDLASALDIAADSMIRLDAAGHILAMNSRAEALFGYDQKEAAGESFLMLLAPASQAEATTVFERIVGESMANPEGEGLELVARDRDGQWIPVRLDFGRLNNAGTHEYFALLRDLTKTKAAEREREAAREAAEKASARKTDFLARVSHEIRTPLHAILGFAEVIMEERFGPIGNDRYKDYIKDIHTSGKHVMSLANDLLDLAKIEAGKMELQFEPIDINKIIRECVALMQPQAARERIIMRLSLFDKLPNVMADERSLRQIMLNLMSNAVKFNEPGGQVIISTALDEGGHSVIRVRDTGVGMNDAELGVALEPFRRVAGGKREDGTGLGLPLTKALAEANHADFSIKSRKEHGTLVEVAFPSAQAAQ